jgi:hypothetical protein
MFQETLQVNITVLFMFCIVLFFSLLFAVLGTGHHVGLHPSRFPVRRTENIVFTKITHMQKDKNKTSPELRGNRKGQLKCTNMRVLTVTFARIATGCAL